jgi:DNA-binding NtrC family response regulator
MTRVLVVHHDLDLADQEAESLRRLGYEVLECGGPTRGPCPVLAGRRCDLAERADVLVYDAWASGDADGARTLIENIRDVHPLTPVVVTSPGLPLSWQESVGRHAVTPLLGQPTGARLHEAIQAALRASSGPAPEPRLPVAMAS